MRNYRIITHTRGITLHNEDPTAEAQITEVTMASFDKEATLFRDSTMGMSHPSCYHIVAHLKNKTVALKLEFEKIPGTKRMPLGQELLQSHQKKDVLAFLDLLQSIEQIPDAALQEIQAIDRGLQFGEIFNLKILRDLVAKQEHQAALELALKSHSEGDPDILSELASLYATMDDNSNFVRVLESFPANHPEFTQANEALHAMLLRDWPQNDEARVIALEKLFRASLNCGLPEASNLFDRLCGGSGHNPAIPNVTGDPDTLILIARNQSKMRKQINDLLDLNKNRMQEKLELDDLKMKFAQQSLTLFKRSGGAGAAAAAAADDKASKSDLDMAPGC